METFSALLAICARNSPVTGEFPAQRPVTRTLMLSLICAWINNGDAGDLSRHRAHYDVTVINVCQLMARRGMAPAGPLFQKPQDVLPPNLPK